MSEQYKDQELLNAIKHELDQSAEHVDEQIQSRLKQIRIQAPQRKKKYNLLNSPFVPISMFATACLVVAVALYFPDGNDTQNPDDVGDWIRSLDKLEFYEELEFYEWLEDYDLPN